MERVKGDWREEVRVRVDYKIFNLLQQTTIWPCLRSGTSDPGQQRNFDKNPRKFGDSLL